MSFDFAKFLDSLGGRDAAQGITAIQQTPTADELAEDSADRAEQFGSGDADGPDVEPTYEPARPITDETHLIRLVETVRSILLDSPAPDRVTVYRINPPAASAGISVQVVPPSEGRRRRVVIECVSGTAYLAPERRDTGSPTTGDTSGFVLDDGTVFSGDEQVELFTTGAMYVSSDGAYDLRVLIEHYPDRV